MKNVLKHPKTRQELCQTFAQDEQDFELVRAKRNFNNLPTDWDDETRNIEKGWKKNKKVRKQWQKNAKN